MFGPKTAVGAAVLILALGIFFGWLWFGGSEGAAVQATASEHQHESEADASVWTCSMHPQIRKDGPGKCPICGMNLIPIKDPHLSESLAFENV